MSGRIIEVVNYDPSWKNIFDSEKSVLAKAIGNNAIRIEHIGSTAVPGLVSKPVIDILIEVESLVELDNSSKEIKTIGYLIKGENGISGRRYFQKGGNQRSHHVHAFQTGDLNLIRHRAFKEYLIAHPIIASEYGKIKTMAILKSDNNINNYMAHKNEFIQKHEKLAVEWFVN